MRLFGKFRAARGWFGIQQSINCFSASVQRNQVTNKVLSADMVAILPKSTGLIVVTFSCLPISENTTLNPLARYTILGSSIPQNEPQLKPT